INAHISNIRTQGLEPRRHHTDLIEVLAPLFVVRDLAVFVAFEEQHLADALVCIYSGRQRCAIGQLKGHIAAPARFERCGVEDNPAIVDENTCFQREVSRFWHSQAIDIVITWQCTYTGDSMILDLPPPFEVSDDIGKSPKDSSIALKQSRRAAN